VGRSDRIFKRPDVYLELARRLPLVRFVMVMALTDAAFHAELKRALPANVDLIDGLPFHAMPHLFRSALLLVSTSAQEGFPNTFLQAGKYGIPIVSLNVDPAGMLSTHGAGIVCGGNVQTMADAVQQLVADADRRLEYAARLVAYIAANHGLEGRCDELRQVIVETVQGPDARRPDRENPTGSARYQPSGHTAVVYSNDHARKRVA
jgi:glycosyltransferase involved in cell wall biosynthesis